MRSFLTGLALSCVAALPAVADTYGDMMFLNQMNDSYCTGNGGRWTGMTCDGGSAGPMLNIEEQERRKRTTALFLNASAAIERAVGEPLEPQRFARRYPDVDLPTETETTAPLFACFRQRIAGLLLSEREVGSYDRMMNLSDHFFNVQTNVRDVYYWTQDILALSSGNDRFLLDFENPAHRQVMTDLVLREAPRAWEELQAAVVAHETDALLEPGGGPKATWFLSDTGLIYAAYRDEDPLVELGRSFYFPARCKNHAKAVYAKLIPVTGHFMDDRIEAFAADPATVRLEGVLPLGAP